MSEQLDSLFTAGARRVAAELSLRDESAELTTTVGRIRRRRLRDTAAAGVLAVAACGVIAVATLPSLRGAVRLPQNVVSESPTEQASPTVQTPTPTATTPPPRAVSHIIGSSLGPLPLTLANGDSVQLVGTIDMAAARAAVEVVDYERVLTVPIVGRSAGVFFRSLTAAPGGAVVVEEGPYDNGPHDGELPPGRGVMGLYDRAGFHPFPAPADDPKAFDAPNYYPTERASASADYVVWLQQYKDNGTLVKRMFSFDRRTGVTRRVMPQNKLAPGPDGEEVLAIVGGSVYWTENLGGPNADPNDLSTWAVAQTSLEGPGEIGVQRNNAVLAAVDGSTRYLLATSDGTVPTSVARHQRRTFSILRLDQYDAGAVLSGSLTSNELVSRISMDGPIAAFVVDAVDTGQEPPGTAFTPGSTLYVVDLSTGNALRVSSADSPGTGGMMFGADGLLGGAAAWSEDEGLYSPRSYVTDVTTRTSWTFGDGVGLTAPTGGAEFLVDGGGGAPSETRLLRWLH